MNKSQAENIVNEAIQDLTDFCPHCNSKTHIQKLFQESYEDKDRDLIFYITFRCVPCKSLIMKTYKFRQNKYDRNENLSIIGWSEKFPNEELILINKFKSAVPEDVLNDFEEGIKCFNKECFKASVSMFRRSLQSSVLNLGADSDKDLFDQIDQLKDNEIITKDIKDWAHNIRIFGNWGAHPQNDNLKDVDEEKTKEAQSFLEEFFNYVYVMPSRVAEARGINNPPEEVTEENSEDNENVDNVEE